MGCLPVGGSWARSVRVRAGRAGGVGGGLSGLGLSCLAAVRSGVWVWASGGAAVLALHLGRRASRSGSGAGGQAVRLGSRLHLGRRAGQWIAGNSGGGGCWSAGQAWAAQPCARSGCPACSRWARWAALWARLHLGAAIGRAVRVARLCAALWGLQWARLNRLRAVYSWRAGVNASVTRLNDS